MARTCHSALSRTILVREVRQPVASEDVRREKMERTKAKVRESKVHLYGMAKVLALQPQSQRFPQVAKVLALEPQSRRFPQVAKVTNHTPIVPQSQLYGRECHKKPMFGDGTIGKTTATVGKTRGTVGKTHRPPLARGTNYCQQR